MRYFFLFLLANFGCLSAESTIILIRHAQADSNVQKFHNSNPNHANYRISNLTEVGKEQATTTAKRLLKQGINENNVVLTLVSPLPRTQQTADILKDAGVITEERTEIDERLIEIQMGEHEGLTISGTNNDFDHLDAHEYNGETSVDVNRRVAKVLDSIKNLNGTVILITHGTPAQEIHRLITGKPKKLKNAETVFLIQ